ncbi:hypothetical protein MKX01_011105 [Papaver californicum]|nr:hypothetical protein MKX01_011105 [Papaver californicum]
MGLYGKTKSGNNESWGLGLLLVFFLDDENNEDHHQQHNNNQKLNENKKKNLTTSSPFKSSPSSGRSSTPRFFNNNKLLISKAQSTISICALLVLFTLFVFTLSTFEPSIHSSPTTTTSKFPRRWLTEKINCSHLDKTHIKKSQISFSSVNNFALQGMGTLFRRGTKPMNDLIVAHLTEDITDSELQLFLRTLHRSSITAKSDVVFIYSSSLSPNFTSIIHQENESFLKLVHHHRTNQLNDSSINVAKKLKTMINSFDVTQFSKSDNKGESLWGKRIRTNSNNSNSAEEDVINELSIGSMVGFETAELDPEDSLSGFFNDPSSIRLRRWACYPMLLGRVRRNFKHIMLVNVNDVVILGDSMSRVRSRTAESVHLWMMNKNSDKTTQFHNKKDQLKQPLTADLIMGGMRGIRRLSNAMLNEIVRATMKHKGKTNTISDSGILSQLIHNEALLKHIEVSVTTESAIPDTSSLVNSKRIPGLNHHHHHNHQNVVHRGNTNLDLNSILSREMCSSLDSLVYSDC